MSKILEMLQGLASDAVKNSQEDDSLGIDKAPYANQVLDYAVANNGPVVIPAKLPEALPQAQDLPYLNSAKENPASGLNPEMVDKFGLTDKDVYQGNQALKTAQVLDGVRNKRNMEREQVGNLNPETETLFQTITKKAGEYFGNEENMLNMALAFNTLRFDPDQQLAAGIQGRLKTIEERKATGQSADSVIKALTADGSPVAKKYAEMVMNNPKMVKEIYAAYIKESGKTTDKFETGSGSYLSSKFNIPGLSPSAVYKYNESTGDITQVNAAETPSEKFDTGSGSYMKDKYGITGLDSNQTYTINTTTNKISQVGSSEKDPIAALKARAKMAGLVEGTPEYQQFMISQGAPKGMKFTVRPDGTIEFSENGESEALTSGQATTKVFLEQMDASENIIKTVEDQGLSFRNALTDSFPSVGNFLDSAASQRYKQAKANWINAHLRDISGATIQDVEFEKNEQQFFPQPGDDPSVVDQKRRIREIVINTMKMGLPGYNQNKSTLSEEQAIQMLKKDYGYTEEDIKKLYQGK